MREDGTNEQSDSIHSITPTVVLVTEVPPKPILGIEPNKIATIIGNI
jgi:hypothetical protein